MTELIDRIGAALVGLKMPRSKRLAPRCGGWSRARCRRSHRRPPREDCALRETRPSRCEPRSSSPSKRSKASTSHASPPSNAALAQLDFIRRRETVHFLGPPGTGKSHLATALGVAAVKAGKASTRRRSRNSPTASPKPNAKASSPNAGRAARRDEIGYLPISKGGASLFFQIVNARYEKGAMILTSNRSFAEWGDIFGDPVVATALRPTLHHAESKAQATDSAADRTRPSECAHHAAARAEKTRAAQKGDPNRRLIWLAAKTPKSGEFCFGTFGEFYFGIDRHGEDPRGEGRRLPRGRQPGSEDRGAAERPERRGGQRPHRQRTVGERGQPDLGVRRPSGAVLAPERRARGRGGGGAVRRGAVDPDRLRGDPARTENDLHPRPVPRPRICVRRRAGGDAGQGQTGGVDGLDQDRAERVVAALKRHRRLEAVAACIRTYGQYGPDALRPLPEARPAGRIRHRGKRLQAHRRKSLKGAGRRWSKAGANAVRCHRMLPRKQALARLPRLEGLQRRSSLTQENGMHPADSMDLTAKRAYACRIAPASMTSQASACGVLHIPRAGAPSGGSAPCSPQCWHHSPPLRQCPAHCRNTSSLRGLSPAPRQPRFAESRRNEVSRSVPPCFTGMKSESHSSNQGNPEIETSRKGSLNY